MIYADIQADMMKLMAAFRDYSNTPMDLLFL